MCESNASILSRVISRSTTIFDRESEAPATMMFLISGMDLASSVVPSTITSDLSSLRDTIVAKPEAGVQRCIHQPVKEQHHD